MQDLGAAMGANGSSAAWAINKYGVVVGSTRVGTDPIGLGIYRATVWRNGAMSILADLGGLYDEALGINDNGVVVGRCSAPGIINQRCTWGSTITMSPPPVPAISVAYAINNAGTIVGFSGSPSVHAFAWPAYKDAIDIATDIQDSYGARSINDAGAIVGQMAVGGYPHAFIRTADGAVADLGTAGGLTSIATDINAGGTVVGSSQVIPGDPNAGVGGVVWRGGGAELLNKLVAPGSRWSILEANAINDGGAIVGVGALNGGARHAVVLLPTVLRSVDWTWNAGALFVGSRLSAAAPFDVTVQVWETRAGSSSPLYFQPPAPTRISAGNDSNVAWLTPNCGVGPATVTINVAFGGATVSFPVDVPYTPCDTSAGGGGSTTGGVPTKGPHVGRQQ